MLRPVHVDLWQAKWQQDRFLSEFFSILLSVSFTHVSFVGWTMGPSEALYHRDILSSHSNNVLCI
jgi:hypothetical protein